MMLLYDEEEGEEVVVAVVTAAGMLKLYKPKLEGKKQKKPLKPWKSLTIAAEKDAKGRVGQINVLAAKLNSQSGVAVGYGLAARPALERMQVWLWKKYLLYLFISISHNLVKLQKNLC